ncbi:hypothetical protein PybrP1_012148 [[Pythium] brassicae (nom. inval.)]|nr:hypothetical protein PybrP1_012148 [[Pythium] brassicae (nom. inval.)]
MLRRVVLRARRRVPAGTAGHDSSDLDGPAESGPSSLDVYHVSRGADGLLAAKARREDLEGLTLDAPPRLRVRAQLHILTVQSEERSAAAAWERLRQLYEVFRRLQQEHEALELAASKPRDEGLRTLLEKQICPPGVVLRDLEAITQELPQGFTPQMFVSLGDALYEEMTLASQRSTIDRDAFAALGDHLYAHAVSVSA